MKVLTAAQDPGGKNAIAPVVAALRARGDEVGEQVERPDVLLVGTSGGPSADKQAIAQWRGTISTVAVLDFWSNYWQRFSSPGIKDFKYLPDVVCVMDDVAKQEMVAEGFPPERLAVTGNPHFDRFADGITCAGEDVRRVLFVSQPIRSDGTQPGFAPEPVDEYGMLEALIDALPGDYRLALRLHPRDERHKYDSYVNERVSVAPEPTLEEALSCSGLVVGPATPVLMQAAAAGKKALHFVPDPAASDPMVSDRVGVTIRIEGAEALKDALALYAAGKWPFTTKPMRDYWPAGATERVVGVVDSLVKR